MLLDMCMKTATAAALFAVSLGQDNGAVRPSSCLSGQSSILDQTNTRCVNMGQASNTGSVGACCGAEGGSTLRQLTSGDDDVCRWVQTDKAYCDALANPAECNAGTLDASDVLTIDLSMDSASTSSASCCEVCTCFGDPECVSFSGDKDEWIVCDGRRNDCKMGRSRCRRERDHNNQRCKWIRNTPSWISWDESGSPCQPDWSNGYPTMSMYKTDTFELMLVLGERGVILEAKITMNNGAGEFTMTSDDCFANDPRLPGSTPTDAWTEKAGSLPSDWQVSTPNPLEIWWKVNSGDGVFMDIVCTKSFGVTARSRLNIQNLLETDPNRIAESSTSGFCKAGTIDEKAGTTARSKALHAKCLNEQLPSLLLACKSLVEPGCGEYSMDQYIVNWCENADLVQTTIAGADDAARKANCIAELTAGTHTERAAKWTEYVCQINQRPVDQCVSEVGQFGWSTFLAANTNGMIDESGTSGSGSCTSSVSLYSKSPSSDCEPGVRIEYYDGSEWQEEIFIPQANPPCSGKLIVTGDENPNLFLYPIRFAQCTLKPTCTVANSCGANAGFSAKVNFETDCSTENPTAAPTPTPPPEHDCYNCAHDVNDHKICNAPDDFTPLGECKQCCVVEPLFNPNNPNEPVCRDLHTVVPYCDFSSGSSERHRCARLRTARGNGKLTIKYSSDNSGVQAECCKECQCWGDPECRNFAGQQEKWILCDARDDTCVVQEEQCKKEKDHGGNDCVWDVDRANALTKRRDISAIGSPCQPDWAASKDALMTMYTIEDGGVTQFDAQISMGERGVIETLRLTTTNGEYWLVADTCFAVGTDAGWEVKSGAALRVGLELDSFDGPGLNEKTWRITDPNTGILVRAVCIKNIATTGQIGYRMNIQNLIETDLERDGTLTGFCTTNPASIDTQGSTVENTEKIYRECLQDLQPAHLLCKALWSPSCTFGQIQHGIETWCTNANIYPDDPNRIQRCINYLKGGNSNQIANKWSDLYCDSVKNARVNGQTVDQFKAQCKSKLQNDGAYETIDLYGDGQATSISASPLCSDSADRYSKRSALAQCTRGVTFEYKNARGVWTEIFFIPNNFPPCGGELVLEARNNKYWPAFIYPVRFQECDIDHDNCPIESSCEATAKLDIELKWTQDDYVCEGTS